MAKTLNVKLYSKQEALPAWWPLAEMLARRLSKGLRREYRASRNDVRHAVTPRDATFFGSTRPTGKEKPGGTWERENSVHATNEGAGYIAEGVQREAPALQKGPVLTRQQPTRRSAIQSAALQL